MSEVPCWIEIPSAFQDLPHIRAAIVSFDQTRIFHATTSTSRDTSPFPVADGNEFPLDTPLFQAKQAQVLQPFPVHSGLHPQLSAPVYGPLFCTGEPKVMLKSRWGKRNQHLPLTCQVMAHVPHVLLGLDGAGTQQDSSSGVTACRRALQGCCTCSWGWASSSSTPCSQRS